MNGKDNNLYLIVINKNTCVTICKQKTAYVKTNTLQVKAATPADTDSSKEMKRERSSPDSLIKSPNFACCLLGDTLYTLNNAFCDDLALLVNSANVINGEKHM